MPLSSDHRRDLNDLRANLAGLTVEARLVRLGWLLSRKYDPGQPREPAGQTGGGRWRSDGPAAVGPLAGRDDPETTGPSGDHLPASTTQEEVVAEDGSRVLTIRIRAGRQTEWDEQHTVTAPDGTRTVFETSGLTQTIRDGESGEILGRSTLTRAGAEPEAFVQAARGPAAFQRTFARAIEAAGTLFAALSSQNGFDRTAVFAAPASEYRTNSDPDLPGIWVGVLNQRELDSACPRNGEVQQIANEMAARVKQSGNYLNAQDYGNKVHLLIAGEINSRKDPNFIAENSYTKEDRKIVSYGTPSSIRLDVLERSVPSTVCVYDHKTGVSGLRSKRASDMAFMVQRNFPGTQRIIVIEVRPSP